MPRPHVVIVGADMGTMAAPIAEDRAGGLLATFLHFLDHFVTGLSSNPKTAFTVPS